MLRQQSKARLGKLVGFTHLSFHSSSRKRERDAYVVVIFQPLLRHDTSLKIKESGMSIMYSVKALSFVLNLEPPSSDLSHVLQSPFSGLNSGNPKTVVPV